MFLNEVQVRLYCGRCLVQLSLGRARTAKQDAKAALDLEPANAQARNPTEHASLPHVSCCWRNWMEGIC